MPTELGFLSLLPSLLAIILAIWTKRVVPSLLAGLGLGYVLLAEGNPLEAGISLFLALVRIFQEPSNVYVLLFTLLMGALTALLEQSGGMAGFRAWIDNRLRHFSQLRAKQRIVQLMAMACGTLLFIETNISILTTGTLFRPLFEHLRLSRAKLAYLCDTTSAPISVLFPFNAWGTFIMGTLVINGFDSPFLVLFSSITWNIYPLLAVGILLATILSSWHFSAMRHATDPPLTKQSKQIENEKASAKAPSQEAQLNPRPSWQARNMLFPLLAMLCGLPLFMLYTGWNQVEDPSLQGWQYLKEAFFAGEGAWSILMSSVLGLLVAAFWYRVQRLLSLRELFQTAKKGIIGMRHMALLIWLAFALTGLTKELHTGAYLASLIDSPFAAPLLPAAFFLLASLISFSTGTSWGTFAIGLSFVLPMCHALGADPVVCVAAVLGGGVFGDHCSPISDTTLISSVAAKCSHIVHVSTQLPYALLAGGLSLVFYIILGLLGS